MNRPVEDHIAPPRLMEDTRFFGHPRGLSTLFFVEMWERFSYYGMRALLILFMVAPAERAGLGFSDGKAGAIYGLYTGTVYLLSLPGGWMADRLFGQRRAVLYGGILIAMGHFSMAAASLQTFYLGLLLIVLGTGLLKPNASTMVGQLYAPGDARRDAGFSIYYMGINLGAGISPLICGYVGEKINWHYGFALAGFGMVVGLLQYARGARHLAPVSQQPVTVADPAVAAQQRRTALQWATVSGALAVLLAGIALTGVLPVSAEGLSNTFGILLLLVVVVVFGGLFFRGGWDAVERKRLVAIFALFVASSIFWGVFEQAGSTLNLFADRNTDLHLLGREFPASWFQALNSAFLITLAPVFAWLWLRLGRHEPSIPAKFAIGLLFVGLGVLILVPVANDKGLSPMWLTMTYLLHTIGELCLSPVGLSALTKLAPVRVAGLMMGVWFLSNSVGNYISGRLASVSESLALPQLFGLAAALTIGLGVVLVLLIRPLKRLMGGVR